MDRRLGDRIAKLAEEKGWSHAQLSQRAGLAKGAVNDIVNNPDRRPRDATIERIADALGVSAAYLLGETDQRGQLQHLERIDETRISSHLSQPWADLIAGAVDGRFVCFRVVMESRIFARNTILIADAERPVRVRDLVIARPHGGGYMAAHYLPPYLVGLSYDGGLQAELTDEPPEIWPLVLALRDLDLAGSGAP